MRVAPAIVAVLAVVSASGCGSTSKAPSTATSTSRTGTASSISVSSDFHPGGDIATVHTCDGRDVSPPLHVSGLPSATRELVVVMRDPDAPGGNFIHWAVAHLVPSGGALSLPAGGMPVGTVLGRNSFGSLGYRGPCPPSGPAHHYVITAYALTQPSGLKTGFTGDDVSALPMLGQGTLTGLYARR